MYYIEDDNVISNAAKHPALRAQLKEKRYELERQGFGHAIAPVILVELLNGLSKSSEVHFPGDQFRFRLLCPSPETRILPSPGQFALKTILNLDSPAASLNERDFSEMLQVVCCAQNLREILEGSVSIDAAERRVYGIDFIKLGEYRDALRQSHLTRMGAFRQGRATLSFSKEDWLSALLRMQGIIAPKPEELDALAAPLDAAYRHDRKLLELASDTGANQYNFAKKKNAGDPIDGEYLMYLANPGVRFLTHDSRIKERIGDCPQRDQIIVLPNLEKPVAAKS